MTQAREFVQPLDGDAIQVNLPAMLTIASSSDLHEALAGIIESTSVVVLEAGGVQKVDTAGLQLLVAFAHERTDQSLLTELRGASSSLVEPLALLGLGAHLQ
jgi:anti-anti-sigma regulatory factor